MRLVLREQSDSALSVPQGLLDRLSSRPSQVPRPAPALHAPLHCCAMLWQALIRRAVLCAQSGEQGAEAAEPAAGAEHSKRRLFGFGRSKRQKKDAGGGKAAEAGAAGINGSGSSSSQEGPEPQPLPNDSGYALLPHATWPALLRSLQLVVLVNTSQAWD